MEDIRVNFVKAGLHRRGGYPACPLNPPLPPFYPVEGYGPPVLRDVASRACNETALPRRYRYGGVCERR